MKTYDIMNKNVLDILEEFRYNYTEKYDVTKICRCIGDADNRYVLTDEYLRTRARDVPENAYSYAIKPSHYVGDVELFEEYSDTWWKLSSKFMTELCVSTNALAQFYPPGGFIGWHSNANAIGHNVIFTWSESGDGCFKFIDPLTKELIVMPDKKGWSLKAGYFGQDDHEVFHCAETKCNRITLSFVFKVNAENYDNDSQLECLDYIQNGV